MAASGYVSHQPATSNALPYMPARVSSASAKVFEIAEILENILLNLSFREIMPLRQVSRDFDEIITNSPILKWVTFRHPSAVIPKRLLEDPRIQPHLPNHSNSNILVLHPLLKQAMQKMWIETIHIDRRSTRGGPYDAASASIFPDDTYITRPPINQLGVSTNSPNSDQVVINAAEGATGITMNHFLTQISKLVLQRYRELLCTPKRKLPTNNRHGSTPEICLRLPETFTTMEAAIDGLKAEHRRATQSILDDTHSATSRTFSLWRQEGAELWDVPILHDTGENHLIWRPVIGIGFDIGSYINIDMSWWDNRYIYIPSGCFMDWEIIPPRNYWHMEFFSFLVTSICPSDPDVRRYMILS
ncbi:hypothetical protein H072_6702 [Dactylellina haptotyla CBS 200.50]|uniref:F-box domain-containing protein n=1 Tax=Dactylellina haptotyla (strain CBS 200.50) TaxID=1284197 RepID=S8A928_DACHA|nr:hypothetical protein H072_6702 [Dactylellina haptotyla CBS 200.50]